ncbi:MAG TPA: hypothetical protein DIS96_00995 [Pusillimonas sp.]|nr:hypothetical protein [Pusillimonas sp.]
MKTGGMGCKSSFPLNRLRLSHDCTLSGNSNSEKVRITLDTKKLTSQIITEFLWKSNGKTPATTVSGRLYSDIKKRGRVSLWKRWVHGFLRLEILP